MSALPHRHSTARPPRLARRVRTLAALAGTALAITACSAQSASTTSPGAAKGSGPLGEITIAQPSHGLHILPLDVAVAKGFFKKEGIDVKIVTVNGDAAAIPALVSGSAQVAQDTSTPVLVADAKSPQLQVIAVMSGPPAQIVLRKDLANKAGLTANSSTKEKVQALKGMTVAVNDVGGGLQYVLNGVLQKYGMKPSDVKVVAISPYTAALAALHSGRVDAIAPVAPYGTAAVTSKDGLMIADVFDGNISDLSTIQYSLLDASSSWLKGHKAQAVAVRAAIKDALDYIKSNPAGAAAVAKTNLPTLSNDVLEASIKNGAYPSDVDVTKAEYQQTASFAGQTSPGAGSIPFGTAVWVGAQG